MTKFNLDTFNLWIQDTQDYSKLKTVDVYLARKSNDCIDYCIRELGMIPQDAWIASNNMYIVESKRLNKGV